MEFKVLRYVHELRIGGETILRLGNANREVSVTQLFNHCQFLLGGRTISHEVGTIKVGRHFRDLGLYIVFILISKIQWLGRFFFDGLYHEFRQFCSSLSTFYKSVVHGKANSHFLAMLTYGFDFLVRIITITVERHNYTLTELRQVFQVFVHIGKALLQSFQVRLGNQVLRYTTMHLQGTGSYYQDSEFRIQTCLAALDVIELFCPQVGPETGFRNGIIAETHGQLCG